MPNTSNPINYRGKGGGTSSFGERYPTGISPKIFTKIDFFEYKRDISNPNAERRQTGSIQLPVPENFMNTTAVRTSDKSLGAMGAFAQFVSQGRGLGDIMDSAGMSISGASNQSLINSVFDIAATLPGGFDSTSQDLARSFSGITPNPHVTILFEGVNLKTYNLNWKVSPRNQQDADTINRIIRRLKGRALPSILEVAGANYALQYPDLVKVSIVGSKQLESTDFAFIERVSVNASVGNSIAFFKDGQPVENTISIDIKEIDIRTREDYEGSGATEALFSDVPGGSRGE